MILEPEQLDTIFKQEIVKYKYKPNWEFFANPFFWLRFQGGYTFRVTEQPNYKQAPVIISFARSFALESLQYLTTDQVKEKIKRYISLDIREFEIAQMQKHLCYENIPIVKPQENTYDNQRIT